LKLLIKKKTMWESYKILDERKYLKEKAKKKDKKNRFQEILHQSMMEYETKQKDMIKILYEKLKLSEKFVKTSQF